MLRKFFREIDLKKNPAKKKTGKIRREIALIKQFLLPKIGDRLKLTVNFFLFVEISDTAILDFRVIRSVKSFELNFTLKIINCRLHSMQSENWQTTPCETYPGSRFKSHIRYPASYDKRV